jgi:hypothetical protein
MPDDAWVLAVAVCPASTAQWEAHEAMSVVRAVMLRALMTDWPMSQDVNLSVLADRPG